MICAVLYVCIIALTPWFKLKFFYTDIVCWLQKLGILSIAI